MEEATVPDNTQLVELSHDAVMSNLRRRHVAKEIYTYTGSILLAMNPYAPLPIYDQETMKSYLERTVRKAKPHVFASAEEAYLSLRKQRRSQSLVVSGESGAGKTETNKHLMRYFAWRSRKGNGTDGDVDLAEAVVQSNPVLEAFGNARTGRNNNSSRFGKFIRVVIETQTWRVAGAVMHTYLLEKSRVVVQEATERNYHSFYMLQAGATAEERAGMELEASCAGYACLRGSTHTNPAWGDDAEEHRKMLAALSHLGVSAATVRELLSMLAAVMHASNVRFRAAAGTENAVLADPEAARRASALAGVADIAPLLLTRTVCIMGETVTIQLQPAQAQAAVAAFCKTLYSLLFEWLVETTNRSIRGTAQARGEQIRAPSPWPRWSHLRGFHHDGPFSPFAPRWPQFHPFAPRWPHFARPHCPRSRARAPQTVRRSSLSGCSTSSASSRSTPTRSSSSASTTPTSASTSSSCGAALTWS